MKRSNALLVFLVCLLGVPLAASVLPGLHALTPEVALLAGALLLGACTGCGDASSGSAGDTAAQEDTSSVVVAMGPTSEPEAGFDPAFGWGAG